MKPQIASSIEQSNRLLSCGVDPKTADMNHRYGSYPTPIIQFDLKGRFIARFSGLREAMESIVTSDIVLRNSGIIKTGMLINHLR